MERRCEALNLLDSFLKKMKSHYVSQDFAVATKLNLII